MSDQKNAVRWQKENYYIKEVSNDRKVNVIIMQEEKEIGRIEHDGRVVK